MEGVTETHRLPAGGAISNMYAMLLARYKMFPEVKEKGMSSVPKLAAFTSEHVRPFYLVFVFTSFQFCPVWFFFFIENLVHQVTV